MFKPEEIEELREYFQPKALQGDSLPDVKDVIDFTNFILRNSDGTKNLYVMVDGTWELVKENIGV